MLSNSLFKYLRNKKEKIIVMKEKAVCKYNIASIIEHFCCSQERLLGDSKFTMRFE